jgi:hypothetical protein
MYKLYIANKLYSSWSLRSWVLIIASALQEPWTETNHEQEVLQSGTLLADYRQN